MHLRLHYFQSNCPDFPPQIGSHGYHKTAKPALEILAEWRFSGPTGSQKGGCRMIRLADFELNFEGKIKKSPVETIGLEESNGGVFHSKTENR